MSRLGLTFLLKVLLPVAFVRSPSPIFLSLKIVRSVLIFLAVSDTLNTPSGVHLPACVQVTWSRAYVNILGNPKLSWTGRVWNANQADRTVPVSVMRPLPSPPPMIISLDPIWASCQSSPSSILITNHSTSSLCWHGALPTARMVIFFPLQGCKPLLT